MMVYIVWREDTKQVSKIHDSYEAAVEEAQRLSIINKGKIFYVMRAKTAFLTKFGRHAESVKL